MKRIETDIWESIPNDPQRMQYVGQRTAQEVFEELRHRLESIGYLPDEYFNLKRDWESGREFPKDADISCTVDYGGSEGIYINISLKWNDDGQVKTITEGFATGKTLGESSADMDRMYLIASAIAKAFHSDGEHARYIRLGEAEQANGAAMYLNAGEQRLLIDSLIDTRNRMIQETQGVEQLLRRATGGIIEFVNEVGARPLKISDYDMAVLAIQDGNYHAFLDAHKNVPERTGELLVLAAGRPGTVGVDMSIHLIHEAHDVPYDMYLTACKNAISTGSEFRAKMFAIYANKCVGDLDMRLYGEMVSEALSNGKTNIANNLIEWCTLEQLRAANPYLMVVAVQRGDYKLASKLAGCGIDINPCANQVINALTWKGDYRYQFARLMERGMQIRSDNYPAMESCIRTDNPEAAKILIDSGMNFDEYLQWAEQYRRATGGDTHDAVWEYWEQSQEPQHTQTMQ